MRLHPFSVWLPAVTLLCGGCVWIFRSVEIKEVHRTDQPVTVQSPVKAHLLDGSTVAYAEGVTVAQDTLRGRGYRYDLRMGNPTIVNRIPLDSVVGMESFQNGVNAATSVFVSILATPVAVAGSAFLYLAIFGSCPTFYADTGRAATLEAEGFSYSIAPLFEVRDVDRLNLRLDRQGPLRLEVRNEALETHYLNHLEILEVRHGVEETALPDERGTPVVVGELIGPSSARDRSGRNVRSAVLAADERSFATDPRTLAAVRVGDLGDFLDLTFPPGRGGDSVALVLRLRNSLLNTVLLYDVMMAGQGAHSLDWMGKDLQRVGPALAMAQWYASRMGLHVSVWDRSTYRPVAHVRDTGPIAWKDLAVVVPTYGSDSTRIRLRFVADNWRIDRVALASRERRPGSIPHPLSRVVRSDGLSDTTALMNMAAVDQRYLQTLPGQRFTAVFDPGPTPRDLARTFFLVSQGYYVEWVRRNWMTAPPDTLHPVTSDAALLAALARWRGKRDDFERSFAATRIPVR